MYTKYKKVLLTALFASGINLYSQYFPLQSVSIYPNQDKPLFSCDTNAVFYYCGSPDWIIWHSPADCDTLRGIGYYDGVPYSGSAEYRIEDQIKAKVEFKEGLPTQILTYYSNGKPLFEGSYVDGIKHGKYAVYSENGSVYRLFNYEYGKLTGHGERRWELRDFGDSESYFMDTCWYINNKKHGKNVSYRNDPEHYGSRNGSIYAMSYYQNGLLHGESMVWYVNGQLKEKWMYKNGKVTGKYICWKPDGSLFYETEFKDGNGVVKQLYQEGTWIKTTKFKDGLPAEDTPNIEEAPEESNPEK